MKNSFFISALLLLHISTNCQNKFTCYIDDPPQLKSSSCELWNHYESTNVSSTPIKTVRITYHVFNKDDGTGNIQNDTDGLDFLDDYTDNLNLRYSQVDEMRVPSSSPHISDSRIRFDLAEVHFWDDTNGYTYPGSYSPTWSNNLYTQFVTNKAAVTYKTTSVHIFISGGTSSSGWASGIGDRDYIVMGGIYSKYQDWLVHSWANASGLAHELGHSLGLLHTWNGDGIDDTPNNNNCWNLNLGDPNCDELEEASNNIMDYNASKSSLTLGQIHRAHFYLLGRSGDIEDCVIETISTQTPTVSGGGLVCDDGLEFQFPNIQLGVEILTSTSTNITSNDCGEEVSFTPTTYTTSAESGSITFSFDYGSDGTTQSVKNISVVGYQYENLGVCDISSTSLISAKTINLPDTGCSSIDAVVDNGNSLSIICEEITLNSGFEVELGGTLDIQTFVCD